MFDHFKYKLKLSKLFDKKELIRSSYEHDIRNARSEGKPRKDIQFLENNAWVEQLMIDEEISILATEMIISKSTEVFHTSSVDRRRRHVEKMRNH